MIFLWGFIVFVAGLIGVAITLLTLSGVWLTLAVAVLLQVLVTTESASGQLFSWWTLGLMAIVALAGEVIELASSAVGAKTTGGGRSGSIGSVLGALGGAIVGSFVIPIPIAGTVIGAVAGAGLGAFTGERAIGGKTLMQSTKVAGGAAAGRAVALFVKVALALVVAVVLTIAAFIP